MSQFKQLIYIQNIKDVIDLNEIQAQIKGIQIKRLIQTRNQQKVYSDYNRIKQILLNLVSNALKYTKNGGQITISVDKISSIKKITSDKNIKNKEKSAYQQIVQENGKNLKSFQQFEDQIEETIRISVTDTGVGIPDQIKRLLFKKYATFDHSPGSNQYGVGLGLVICQQLAGLLGPHKRIEVESSVGLGSKFSFYIYQNLNKMDGVHVSTKQEDRYREIKLIEKSLQEYDFNQKQNQKLKKQVIFATNQNDSIILRSHSQDNSIRSNINLQDVYIKKSQDEIQEEKNHINQSYRLSISEIHQKQETQQNIINTIFPQQCQILVVDDEPVNHMAIQFILKCFSWVVIKKAFNGKEALQIIQEMKKKQHNKDFIPIQYIFIDLTMPIMDGYETIKQIRQLKIKWILKIIAVTGYSDNETITKCISLGFDGYLIKPIDIKQMISSLTADSYE